MNEKGKDENDRTEADVESDNVNGGKVEEAEADGELDDTDEDKADAKDELKEEKMTLPSWLTLTINWGNLLITVKTVRYVGVNVINR